MRASPTILPAPGEADKLVETDQPELWIGRNKSRPSVSQKLPIAAGHSTLNEAFRRCELNDNLGRRAGHIGY